MVLLEVDRRVRVEYLADVVRCTGVIEGAARGDRHERAEPGVGVVEHGCQEPEEEDEASRDVRLRPPRRCQRRTDIRNLCPVECDERHAHSTRIPKELVDLDVVRRDPAYPGEDGERLEGVAREEVPSCGGEKGVEEEALARYAPAVANAGVLLRVERIEKRAVDEVSGPDCN